MFQNALILLELIKKLASLGTLRALNITTTSSTFRSSLHIYKMALRELDVSTNKVVCRTFCGEFTNTDLLLCKTANVA